MWKLSWKEFYLSWLPQNDKSEHSTVRLEKEKSGQVLGLMHICSRDLARGTRYHSLQYTIYFLRKRMLKTGTIGNDLPQLQHLFWSHPMMRSILAHKDSSEKTASEAASEKQMTPLLFLCEDKHWNEFHYNINATCRKKVFFGFPSAITTTDPERAGRLNCWDFSHMHGY